MQGEASFYVFTRKKEGGKKKKTAKHRRSTYITSIEHSILHQDATGKKRWTEEGSAIVRDEKQMMKVGEGAVVGGECHNVAKTRDGDAKEK